MIRRSTSKSLAALLAAFLAPGIGIA